MTHPEPAVDPRRVPLTSRSPSDVVRGAAIAVGGVFAANGTVVGAFGGSLPGLRDLLDLGDGQIVWVLVVAAASAVVAMQVSGRVADRVGARLPTYVGAGVLLLGALVIASAQSYPWLLVGAFVFGVGNGALDVAMNTLGVGVEQARGRPVMSRFHAFFSIGNFVGSGSVVVLGGVGTRVPIVVCVLIVVVLLLALRRLTPQTPVAADHDDGPRRIPAMAWVLAIMAICFGLTEGTGIDWSSIHVTDVTGVSAHSGAWGLAAVSGLMVLIRLFGDHAVARLGRRRVVACGSLCALIGYVLAATATPLWLVLPAWCLVGLGVGLIAPQIYGLAGHLGGGRVLALVVSFGYAAFLTGPAVIGFIAVHTDTADRPGIQNAMLLPAFTALLLSVLSTRLPGRGGTG